jgi:hypothetical protein
MLLTDLKQKGGTKEHICVWVEDAFLNGMDINGYTEEQKLRRSESTM